MAAAQKAAAIDGLTGIMNCKSFRKNIAEILKNMSAGKCGILIDGDHFKRINDTCGHTAGDDVIRLVAQMIVGRIRTVDLASRLHGDEFAIFLSDIQDPSIGQRVMSDINVSLAEESVLRGLPAITLSAGAVFVRYGDKYSELIKAADAALYKAKSTHDGRFVLAEKPSVH
ncbi:GGDEF domain-containing protein [Lachnotalea sp. AF33-28]|uniref:GGDEF domain-containing protein n=1 Tax=Lachnotalea sp. AF33-28 TaxID=2292046 RepID=UPI001FAACDAC|nr:GGDEF domain-containing protein [Lachnotalea sp. AF33-28]